MPHRFINYAKEETKQSAAHAQLDCDKNEMKMQLCECFFVGTISV